MPTAEVVAPKNEAVPPAPQPQPSDDIAPKKAAVHSEGNASLLQGSISLSIQPIPSVVKPVLQSEQKPLEQEDLERYWEEIGEELDLHGILKDSIVRLSEHVGVIEIDAQTTHFHEDFKPHSTAVMEALRAKSGMKMLECKVNQMYVDEQQMIYSPEHKYDVMLKANSAMAMMRQIFPDIDY